MSGFVIQPSPDVPAEPLSSQPIGVAAHLGPAVVFVAVLAGFGISLPLVLMSFAIVSVINLLVVLELERRAPAVILPPPDLAAVRRGLALVFVKGVLCGGAVVAGGWWLLSGVPSATHQSWPAIVAAVLLTDWTYYWIHRALNHGRGANPILRWFRRRHAMHHNVEHLDFLRGNVSSFFDTAVTGFQAPLALIATALGLDLTATMTAYALVLMLQATHHLNHTLHLGPLRYVFMDNHAHKLHHCPRGRLVNHGALFSLWDRLHGTFYEDFTLSSGHLAASKTALPIRPA